MSCDVFSLTDEKFYEIAKRSPAKVPSFTQFNSVTVTHTV